MKYCTASRCLKRIVAEQSTKALSQRTGLRLYDFTCAWFDEHHYYEFYPLHVVYKRGRSRPSRHQYGQNM